VNIHNSLRFKGLPFPEPGLAYLARAPLVEHGTVFEIGAAQVSPF
jgi:hypothetical protein